MNKEKIEEIKNCLNKVVDIVTVELCSEEPPLQQEKDVMLLDLIRDLKDASEKYECFEYDFVCNDSTVTYNLCKSYRDKISFNWALVGNLIIITECFKKRSK